MGRLSDEDLSPGEGKREDLVFELENIVYKMIVQKGQKEEELVEELLIGMMGHPLEMLRDKSVVLLNSLYDEVDWQIKYSFNPKVRQVGDPFVIDYMVAKEENVGVEQLVIMVLGGAQPHTTLLNQQDTNYILNKEETTNLLNRGKPRVLSWHKVVIKEYNDKYQIVSCDLGIFKRCGFYDWKLVGLQKNGQIKSVNKIYEVDDINKSMKSIEEV